MKSHNRESASRTMRNTFQSLLFFFALTSLAYAAVPEPDSYRMDDYDAPVPATLRGATRVTAIDVRALQKVKGAIIVDVIPEHRRPDFLPEKQIWIPVPHKGLPGALWLPDVGFGPLSDVTEQYFRRHIENATDGDLNHPLIFYCRIDCWMSWNAAKRALTYGYRQVYWFADGIEDWAFEGFAFDILQPAEGQRQEELAPATENKQ